MLLNGRYANPPWSNSTRARRAWQVHVKVALGSDPKPERRLLNVAGARRLLLEIADGMTPGRSTMYRWVQDGYIPSIRMGRKLYVPVDQLNAIIKGIEQGNGD